MPKQRNSLGVPASKKIPKAKLAAAISVILQYLRGAANAEAA